MPGSLKLEELIGTEMLPAIGSDELLLKKFKHFAHIPLGIRTVHHPLNLTLQETRLSPFLAIFSNAKKKVASIVQETCIQCKIHQPPSVLINFNTLD